MEGQNQNNIFNEETKEDEGDISRTSDTSHTSETSDDDSDEFWNDIYQNQVIIPTDTLISGLLGLSSLQFIPVQTRIVHYSQTSSPIRQRVRQREDTTDQRTEKALKDLSGEKINLQPSYNYLRLKSGVEFKFIGDESTQLLLPREVESNYYIRNIIANIPNGISNKLKYLGQFESEEELEEGEIQTKYEGNLKELVYEAYIKESRLKFAFKRLLNIWRIYKMNMKCEKEIDPITLSEPEKEIIVYDWSVKRKFIFDAKSLAMLIESKLLYHEYGFPVPLMPKNPKNNVEFSYKHLVSIYNQLKLHGELRWAFTTLKNHTFDKNIWYLYNKSALIVNSIRSNIIQLDSQNGRDLLLDFIFTKMEEFEIGYTTNIYNIYQKAMIKVPDHWYLAKLKSLAISYYEAEHFGQNRNYLINIKCLNIFKNEKAFFEDLRKNKIIV
jgi:hypothetical protein